MTSLSPLHTIGDQVSEAVLLHQKVGRHDAMDLTEEMFELVGFPDPARALNIYPFELSGGLRQRAMIAMALICRPALLIADEPTTALDVTIQAQILHLIRRLQERFGMAVLIITHDLGVVANVAEQIVVLYHGQVMEKGSADDIFRRPSHPYLKALLTAVPRFDMEPGDRLVPIRDVDFEIGPMLAARDPWPDGADSVGAHLSVKNVTKRFQIRKEGWTLRRKVESVIAVDDVSFDVRREETLGLVGESGCGKTTLSKLVLGAAQPDSGEMHYNDRGRMIDLRDVGADDLFELRRKLQYIFQDPFASLNPRMTVFDIIREPLIIHSVGDDPYQREMIKDLMRLVGLDPRLLNRYPHSFSGGQRQRIGIARALALRPDFLICDEPVSALDVSIQAQVMNLLKELQSELGLTYLFISHNLAVIDYVADRIAVMCRGRLVEIAPREVLFKNPVHPYTNALVSAVPYPDLDKLLDLDVVMRGRASEPADWAPPFTINEEIHSELIEFESGHAVRAAAGTPPSDLK